MIQIELIEGYCVNCKVKDHKANIKRMEQLAIYGSVCLSLSIFFLIVGEQKPNDEKIKILSEFLKKDTKLTLLDICIL
jgi:hypothetical protein